MSKVNKLVKVELSLHQKLKTRAVKLGKTLSDTIKELELIAKSHGYRMKEKDE